MSLHIWHGNREGGRLIFFIRKVYLASGHEAGGDCLAPGAHHLADGDLCVRDPGEASVAIKPDHPPGP